MDYCNPQSQRRHNPVDSICRKLQTIQWRGDREPNSPFQIPKLSSSSYDSPQSGLRHNLEAILKKGALHRDEGEQRERGRRGEGMSTPKTSQRNKTAPSDPLSTTFTPPTPFVRIPPTPANVTYTITSTLGERRGADGGDLRQRYCSTPATQSKDFFPFPRGVTPLQPEGMKQSRSPPLSCTFGQSRSTISYNLNFRSGECELPYPALVVKRLSMGDGGAPESRKENMAEVSLICEEDLLDTIFHACDTQRRGKVYVSRIVDYLRHTTSRTSEDSGLEELCNMLDPEQKDVSIDLDTYHAIMKEWIEDCRNNGEESAEDLMQDSVKLRDTLAAKRSMLLNMTSGSLEAFGGDASRAEFETSELVNCVADLQMSNHKLQEEVRKLKQAVEDMEDSNQKLAEENEELRNQARVNQQLAQKEKLLKEEVEEMKATLSCTEEGRARASAHSKHMEKENQSLIAKITSLQEENFKVTMEMDELQRRIAELCDLNADLQVQIHSFDAVISEKESLILEKSRQIRELKATVEEYSSVTELLRADKNKLENQVKMMYPDLAGAGLSLSVAYRLNQSTQGSLQTELALAQSPLEAQHGVDHLSTTMSVASPLDETLDREVLLLMQGPSPEHMSLEFKNLLCKLKRDFAAETSSVLSRVRASLHHHAQPGGDADVSLQTVQAELDARRADWALSLDQLAQYTDSLERELIKMASNMRRSRTEILHLSVRVQEQENQRRQLCEELEQLKAPQDSREASCQTPLPEPEPEEELDWDEEFAFRVVLKNEPLERNCKAQDGQNDGPEEPGDKAEEAHMRDTSTPLCAPSDDAWPWPNTAAHSPDAVDSPHSEPDVNGQPLQEEAAVPPNTHSQAVGVGHPKTNALSDPAHSENDNAGTLEASRSHPGSPAHELNTLPDQDRTVTPGNTPEIAAPDSTTAGPGDCVALTESSHPPSSANCGGGEVDSTTEDMSVTKSLSRDQLADRSAAVEDSASLLPVLVEEEESALEGAAGATNMAGTNELTGNTGGSPLSPTGLSQEGGGMASLTSDPSQASAVATKDSNPLLGKIKKEVLLKEGRKHSTLSVLALPRIRLPFKSESLNAANRFDLLTFHYVRSADRLMECAGSKRNVAVEGRVSTEGLALKGELGGEREQGEALMDVRLTLQELSRTPDAHKGQKDPSETSVVTEKESEKSMISDKSETGKEEKHSLSPTDKEIETEFQRLALGVKCDMFTLDKRLRLEERSRDLAEENVRKEVSSCQGLLQALAPRCEEDNQSMEIVHRLQKNLEILIQSMTRVSSRSEMLGAIHQENRIGKTVEVMIQHVENLRRVYAKEHAELVELRESMLQNERSFGSQTDKDDFRGKKQATAQYYKSSSRRVSISSIPRSSAGNIHFDTSKSPDSLEAETERLTRRSPWTVAGRSTARPPLKRFVSSAAWVDTEEPSLVMKGASCDNADCPLEDEQRELPVVKRRKSSLTELGNKLASIILSLKTPSPSPSPTVGDPGMAQSLSHSLMSSSASASAGARGGRGLWLWLAMLVVLAGLLALLASLVMQPAVDAAPVGTGDSWMTIQQLLWPYTGLRYNGQPPV
ncbi:inositol 1,4,5-triphosphate receptor associated 2 [Genypterus blacodes]|uniref:inositol 1,4,5-triphosphate receptor associated 2 n=1 Tax=Genypterus blacodes TaxID=154954 RepID=UPI003F776EFB